MADMHGDSDHAPVKPGDTIAGKYLVERFVGSGGVGVVVAAKHLQLGERVALKFLLPKAAKNVVDVARFCREAQATSKLKTEHVTRVLDTGVLEDGSPYMVMEFLEGRDLNEMLKAEGPAPVGEALEYVLQAGVALAEAHELGIIHRDIKPSNLFLTTGPDGSPLVKVLDFGIAKASVDVYAGVGPQNLTKTSALLGSPLYMSPEQIRSTKSVDARSDIWSLGVVLYELLCGATPFDSESLTGVVAGVIGSSPPPLGMRRADLDPGLVAVIDRCLAKEPADRHQSMAELATALEPFAPDAAKISVVRILRLQRVSARAEHPWAKTPTADTSEPPSATARTLRSESSAPPPARPKPRTGKFVLAAAALLVAFAGAVGISWYAREPALPAVAPSSADTVPETAAIVPAATSTATPEPAASVDAGQCPDAALADAPVDAGAASAAAGSPKRSEANRDRPVRVAHPNVPKGPKAAPSSTKPASKEPTKPNDPNDLLDETVDTRR